MVSFSVLALLVGLCFFVPWPLVLMIFAIVGIPLGIKYGSQDKFWT
jgi:hypothetical protein